LSNGSIGDAAAGRLWAVRLNGARVAVVRCLSAAKASDPVIATLALRRVSGALVIGLAGRQERGMIPWIAEESAVRVPRGVGPGSMIRATPLPPVASDDY